MVSSRDQLLVLSETCGAAEALADVATIVSPFDLEEQAAALVRALELDGEQRPAAAQRLRAAAARYTLPRWVDEQLAALDGAPPSGAT